MRCSLVFGGQLRPREEAILFHWQVFHGLRGCTPRAGRSRVPGRPCPRKGRFESLRDIYDSWRDGPTDVSSRESAFELPDTRARASQWNRSMAGARSRGEYAGNSSAFFAGGSRFVHCSPQYRPINDSGMGVILLSSPIGGTLLRLAWRNVWG